MTVVLFKDFYVPRYLVLLAKNISCPDTSPQLLYSIHAMQFEYLMGIDYKDICCVCIEMAIQIEIEIKIAIGKGSEVDVEIDR